MKKKTMEIDVELYSMLDDGMDVLRAILHDDEKSVILGSSLPLLAEARKIARRYEKYLDRKFRPRKRARA